MPQLKKISGAFVVQSLYYSDDKLQAHSNNVTKKSSLFIKCFHPQPPIIMSETQIGEFSQ